MTTSPHATPARGDHATDARPASGADHIHGTGTEPFMAPGTTSGTAPSTAGDATGVLAPCPTGRASALPRRRATIIAEVGLNHGGDPDLAWEMIESAWEHGADLVKLQSFASGGLLHPSLPYAADMEGMMLSMRQHEDLFERAARRGIRLMTTPFDAAMLALCVRHRVPAVKVASMDLDNTAHLRAVASSGLPVLVSCGMGCHADIEAALVTLREAGCTDVTLLHCISDYPARLEDMQLAEIPRLAARFGVPVGLSDHSLGLEASCMALALGASVIERHFTTDPALAERIPGADHDISITPRQLRELRLAAERTALALGGAERTLAPQEVEGRTASRRGLYARTRLAAGHILREEDVTALRPVAELPASALDLVLGRPCPHDIAPLAPIPSAMLAHDAGAAHAGEGGTDDKEGAA